MKSYYLDGKRFYYQWNRKDNPPTISVYDEKDEFIGTYDNLDDFRVEYLSSNTAS